MASLRSPHYKLLTLVPRSPTSKTSVCSDSSMQCAHCGVPALLMMTTFHNWPPHLLWWAPQPCLQPLRQPLTWDHNLQPQLMSKLEQAGPIRLSLPGMWNWHLKGQQIEANRGNQSSSWNKVMAGPGMGRLYLPHPKCVSPKETQSMLEEGLRCYHMAWW